MDLSRAFRELHLFERPLWEPSRAVFTIPALKSAGACDNLGQAIDPAVDALAAVATCDALGSETTPAEAAVTGIALGAVAKPRRQRCHLHPFRLLEEIRTSLAWVGRVRTEVFVARKKYACILTIERVERSEGMLKRDYGSS